LYLKSRGFSGAMKTLQNKTKNISRRWMIKPIKLTSQGFKFQCLRPCQFTYYKSKIENENLNNWTFLQVIAHCHGLWICDLWSFNFGFWTLHCTRLGVASWKFWNYTLQCNSHPLWLIHCTWGVATQH
jgi:hypothetical protein